ncbi:MAG: OmpH family outer membrane protein [Magnetococcus sp. DMHC-6]
MLKWLSFLCVFTFCLAHSPGVQAGSAQFAYVDITEAMTSSVAAKHVRDMLKQKIQTKQKEIDSLETEIKGMKADLEKRKNMMTPEANAELTGQIRSKFREYQRLVEDNQGAIDRENGRWTKKITETLSLVIEEIGKEKGFTVVFGKGQVLYADKSIDITSEVLNRLNSRTKGWF